MTEQPQRGKYSVGVDLGGRTPSEEENVHPATSRPDRLGSASDVVLLTPVRLAAAADVPALTSDVRIAE
jgi:hypothetical protein